MEVIVRKSNLEGTIAIPGSKSHTLRAVLIAALAEGESIIANPLLSNDTRSALHSAECFGARCCTDTPDGTWRILGTGGMPQVPENVIDCGNSGGTTYFTTAIASTVPGITVVTGDAQIRKRPIRRLLSALRELGAEAFTTRDTVDAAPVVVKGPIHGGVCHFDGLLSSYITGVLIAAPTVSECTEIRIADPKEVPYLEMTIDWLRKQNIRLEVSDDYRRMLVPGGQKYACVRRAIPGDWSSAAFPLVAAVITGSHCCLTQVDYGDTQGDKAIVALLQKMGANIVVDRSGNSLEVFPGTGLTDGGIINMENIPDALPALAVAAAVAQGKTIFTGIRNVRLKETDRVAVMQSELRKMGISVEADGDTMTVYGGTPLRGAVVESFGDHRVAMALVAAGMVAQGETVIRDAESVCVSYPSFLDDMQRCCACIEVVSD